LPVVRDPMRPSYNDARKPSVRLEIEKLEAHCEVLATGSRPRREFPANRGKAANGRCSGRAIWRAAFTCLRLYGPGGREEERDWAGDSPAHESGQWPSPKGRTGARGSPQPSPYRSPLAHGVRLITARERGLSGPGDSIDGGGARKRGVQGGETVAGECGGSALRSALAFGARCPGFFS